MEQIISLILFVFPGVFINLLYKQYLPKSKQEPSDYEKAVIAFIYSFMVLVLNIVVMKFIFKKEIETLDQLLGYFKNTSFLLKYVFLTIFTSMLFAIVWHYIFKYLILWAYNFYRKLRGLPKETRFSSVWDEIFENPDNDMTDAYVVIEKDGDIISQGIIDLYSPIDSKDKEIKLICTDSFKKYLENDKLLTEDEKIFNEIDYEYYNIETGVLIKFYNNKRIKEYLKKFK